MFNDISNWLDRVLKQEISDEVAAFCFNLYENEDNNWSMELIGTESFDADDNDWPCTEVTDFGTRENCFSWQEAKKWDEMLSEIISVLKDYLENGAYANILKEKSDVGVGFVDGDIEIIYQK